MNQPDPPRARKRILIGEDDPAIADALKIALEEDRLQVDICSDGVALLDLARTFPDLILLDIWMPGVDGALICRQLKAASDTKHIPIVMISANRDTVAIAQTAGADDFIEKPFDIDEVIRIVEKHVDR